MINIEMIGIELASIDMVVRRRLASNWQGSLRNNFKPIRQRF